MKRLGIISTLIVMMCLVVLFVGCSTEDSSNDDNLTTETTTVGEKYANNEESDEYDNDDISVLEENPASVDLKGFYLLKNDKYYSLGVTVNNDYTIGVPTANDAGRILYSNAAFYEKSGTWTFHTYGEIPELTLSDGGKVVAFSDVKIPTLSLYKIDFYGYGMGVSYNNDILSVYSEEAEDVISAENVSDYSVKEEGSEDEVDDYYDLDPEKTYVASWHLGTNYGEVYGKANNKVYTYKPGFDASSAGRESDYTIEGMITDLGYAEYDFSGVAPGYYSLSGSVQSSGIIRVE